MGISLNWLTIVATTAALIMLWAVVFGAAIYFLHEVIRFTWFIPAAIAFLWLALAPMLNYYAGVTPDNYPFQPEVAWYGKKVWQLLIFWSILIVGYGLLWWHHKNNYYYY